MAGQLLQACSKPGLQCDLRMQPLEVQRNDAMRRESGIVEQTPDLAQWHSGGAQRLDLLQSLDVGVPIQAMSRRCTHRRFEQADLVVMVQGSDRQPCPTGEDTDFHGSCRIQLHAREFLWFADVSLPTGTAYRLT